jgi:hypothetical protein
MTERDRIVVLHMAGLLLHVVHGDPCEPESWGEDLSPAVKELGSAINSLAASLDIRGFEPPLGETRNREAHLEGLIPICMYCKKIRDKDDQWEILERYIESRSSARFSHGICPECLAKHFGEQV